MAMSPKLKNKLSAAVVGLILAGASASVILDQFLDEKEGNSLKAYRDGGGIWTICRGATMVDGKPVEQGMKVSAEKCARVAMQYLVGDAYLNGFTGQWLETAAVRHLLFPLQENTV